MVVLLPCVCVTPGGMYQLSLLAGEDDESLLAVLEPVFARSHATGTPCYAIGHGPTTTATLERFGFAAVETFSFFHNVGTVLVRAAPSTASA